MTRQKRFGELLIEGLQEAVAYERGELPARARVVETSARGTCVDAPPAYDGDRIRAVRRLLAFSQRVFAEALLLRHGSSFNCFTSARTAFFSASVSDAFLLFGYTMMK